MSEPNRQYHQALSANRKLLDENARLKAEVERLTEAHSDALADFWAIHKGYFDLKAEVERLRVSSFVTAVPIEQYERVIKAGDAMADAAYAHCMCQDCEELRDQWRDAKEGKPSV